MSPTEPEWIYPRNPRNPRLKKVRALDRRQIPQQKFRNRSIADGADKADVRGVRELKCDGRVSRTHAIERLVPKPLVRRVRECVAKSRRESKRVGTTPSTRSHCNVRKTRAPWRVLLVSVWSLARNRRSAAVPPAISASRTCWLRCCPRARRSLSVISTASANRPFISSSGFTSASAALTAVACSAATSVFLASASC